MNTRHALLPIVLLLVAASAPSIAMERQQANELLGDLVAAKPKNKEILFVNLLFQHRNLCLDADELESFHQQVRRISDRRFEKKYGGSPLLRNWLLTVLDQLDEFHQNKDEDMNSLATKMSGRGRGLEFNEVLNNYPHWKLLFLIQYGSQQPQTRVLARDPKEIKVAQLLEVMRAEHNSRY